MNHGVVEQLGRPWEIYNTPINRFVAGFIGTTNFFEGTWISGQGGEGIVQVADIRMKVSAQSPCVGEKVSFAIRPEAFKVAEEIAEAERSCFLALPGKVSKVEYLGFMTKYDLELCPGLFVKVVSYDVLPQNLRKTGETARALLRPPKGADLLR